MHTCASSEPPPFSSLIFDETLSNLEQLGNSTPDNTTYKDARSLIVFLAQSAGFLVLTVLAILRYADVIKTRSHGSNYPRQSRDMSVELRGNAVGMSVGIALSVAFLSLLTKIQAGTVTVTFNMPILVCLGVDIGSMRFSWEMGIVALVLGVLCIALRFIYIAGLGPLAAKAHSALIYFCIISCYISYVWTLQVLITIVYIIAEGLSASYYYQRNSTCQHGSFDILKRVCTTSFGSIFQAACAPFWFHFGNPKYSTVKPSIAKYALYYVAALDADYSKAVTDVETSFAKSGMTSRLEMYIMEKVLFTNALIGGLATDDLTAGAAAEAATASVFIAIAYNPVAFARLHPLLIKEIWNSSFQVPNAQDPLSMMVMMT
ncbi:hypothetical protein CPC16_011960 [Podila verticillata]|nr:hypothetical protein CPC16_011960 [Podila verticillata]